MPHSTRFDAVIFDCDGVLVDSEVLAIRGERAALSALGLDYTPEEYVRRFVGLHDPAFFAALHADYRRIYGVEAASDLTEKVLDGRRREMNALAVVADADRALRDARSRAGRIAVASSSRANALESKLRRTGLFDLVAPHVYSADLVANGKPAPDVFLYAADRLGADPARCLAIEDSIHGVRAAAAAGMTVWGFLGGGHCFAGYGDRLLEAGAAALMANHSALSAAL